MVKLIETAPWLFAAVAKAPSGKDATIYVPWFWGTRANSLDVVFREYHGSFWSGAYRRADGSPSSYTPVPVTRDQRFDVTDLSRFDGYGLVRDEPESGVTVWTEMATVSCEAGGPVARALALAKAGHWTSDVDWPARKGKNDPNVYF